MNLEKTKLTLLAHSKKLLIASQEGDWQRYSELESNWNDMLQKAQQEFGNELNVIANALIADNQVIQENITKSQKTILSELEKNTQNTASIRSYLKIR